MFAVRIGKVGPVESRSGHSPSVLANRYELSEVIGRGGMAIVWRAYDGQLRRRVAVKVLLARVAEDPSFQRRFQREARHIASLSHPNIARVFDYGTDGDASFIVMEYVEGPSLRQILDHAPVLGISSTAALASDVLAGLEHAHERGIVHRDMKPGNILVSSDMAAKVVDFGVAKSLGDTTELTIHGSFVGTATYASPEQFMARPVGPASDLYSVGCVLYRCLAGRPPFEDDDVEKLILQHRFAEAQPITFFRSDVPESMAYAIYRALAKDPATRFASAEEMREVFSQFAGSGLDRLVASLPAIDDASGGRGGEVGVETTEVAIETRPIETQDSEGLYRDGPHRSAPRVSKTAKRWLGLMAVGSSVVLLAVGLSTGWKYRLGGGPTRTLGQSKIVSGGYLQSGQSVSSPNGNYLLSMQSDGNLVDYARQGMVPQWESGTSGNFGAYAVMQVDGDFVVYPMGKSAPAPGQPTPALWSSGSYGHPGSYADLKQDGQAVVRTEGGSILWRSARSPQ